MTFIRISKQQFEYYWDKCGEGWLRALDQLDIVIEKIKEKIR